MTAERQALVRRYAYALGARAGYQATIVNGVWVPWTLPQAGPSRQYIQPFRDAVARSV